MVGPVSGASDAVQPSRNTDDETKKALQLVNAMDIMLFFVNLWKQQGDIPADDSSSLEGKIKHIEQELHDGLISVDEAAGMIMSLVKEYEKSHSLGFPTINIVDTKNYAERVAEQVFAYQSFVKQFAEKEGSLIDNADGVSDKLLKLGNQVQSNQMLPQEGIAQLVATIDEVNQQMSPSLRYPLPPTIAYE